MVEELEEDIPHISQPLQDTVDVVDLQSRQKPKTACSSKVSDPVWQHQVTEIFQTKFSYAGDSVKRVSETLPTT